MSAPTLNRQIGDSVFPAIGYGAMGLGGRTYGKVVSSENEPRFKVLDRLLELGCTHWDTANVYGDSEELIGSWFKRTGQRDKIFLATKFGFRPNGPCGTPEYVKQCLEESLRKLNVDTFDLYYVHRIDKNTPIEVTMNALVELVKAGKIRQIGLSQPSPATLRRAHKVHPIAAIQVEYSPFERAIEQNGHLLETARELGVAIVAYSPLSKGLLTGQIKHNATSGQVALAYLLALGDDIIPIPGSQRIEYIEENFAAAQIKLSPEEFQSLKELVNQTKIDGDQYPPALQAMLYADTPELS
ncbi:Aldo kereductase [Rhizoctonia solani]|uniref:Aldo kereductase n=1 Tax=Rhizoctonia solani TaxID=456999 RepID=A0A8H7IKI8_9AGAM|nr:Aldo kereductase [Rhizoctonia solani]